MDTDVLFVALDRASRIPTFHVGFSALLQGLNHTRPEIRTDYIDLNLEPGDPVEAVTRRRPRVVAFSPLFTKDVPRALQLATAIKRAAPATRVVTGGYHVTAEPVDLLEHEAIDVAVRGQALGSIDVFAEALRPALHPEALRALPGVCFREGNRLHVAEAARISREDVRRHYAWAPFRQPLERYPVLQTVLRRSFHGFNRRSVPLVFAIGCPKPCGFCTIARTADGNPLARGAIYYRDAAHVLEDIRAYADRGVTSFNFVDDNFTASIKEAKGFCRMLIESGLRIRYDFTNGIRVDYLDEELIGLMARSGCVGFGFGVESGSVRVRERLMLKAYGSTWTNERFTERLRDIRRWSGGAFLGGSGMTVPFIILGYPAMANEPAETSEEIDQSITMVADWVREGLVTAAHFSIFLPLPGTTVWQSLAPDVRARYKQHYARFTVEDASHLASILGGRPPAGGRFGLAAAAAWRSLRTHRPGVVRRLPLPALRPPRHRGAALLELKQLEGDFSLVFARPRLRDSVAAVKAYLAPSGETALEGMATRLRYVYYKLMPRAVGGSAALT